ncbi:hypothetical protein KPNIH1_13485 [Klebsiella pneumoniae subsp. pneumoniae KPNIH1]|nr:hypothetical protein KPNIH1_13485 [Klebsiella pneumoniae subsp. pneumoniae KPNIH1]AIE28623.1 hypothetical protein KPR0928_13500 [Klebsiella pneumoniae subsp. pneumoniae KPR0928]
MRKEIEVLKHHADGAADLPGLGIAVGDGHAPELDAPLLVPLKTIDAAQQGAFARAAAADDRDYFPHVDIQIDALQHMVVAVVLLHLINGDERH